MTYTFALDVPKDLVAPARVIKYPAHFGNMGYPKPGQASQWFVTAAGIHLYRGRPNVPRALVYHTVEEDADDYEAAPVWFASAQAPNSMHYYADNDGDLYQMVADTVPAWGHGTHRGNTKLQPVWFDGFSNNTSSLGIEIEGRAAAIGRTFSRAQRRTVVLWTARKALQYEILLDRDHVLGHEELTIGKSDPGIRFGTFPIEDVLEEAQRAMAGDDTAAIRREIEIAQESLDRAVHLLEVR